MRARPSATSTTQGPGGVPPRTSGRFLARVSYWGGVPAHRSAMRVPSGDQVGLPPDVTRVAFRVPRSRT